MPAALGSGIAQEAVGKGYVATETGYAFEGASGGEA